MTIPQKAAHALLSACQEAVPVLIVAVRAGAEIEGFDPEDHTTIKALRSAIKQAGGWQPPRGEPITADDIALPDEWP